MLKSLFTTTKGNFIIFSLLLGVVLVVTLLSNQEEAAIEAQMTDVIERNHDFKPVEFIRNNMPFSGFKFRRGEELKKNEETKRAASNESYPREVKRSPVNILRQPREFKEEEKKKLFSTKKKPTPLDLYTSQAEETMLSDSYAPYGRLVPCETVITIDSSRMNTPILGLVTEDVYHNGRLIIPAGAEVHGKASSDTARERIDASGSWVLVWRDQSELSGSELKLEGIALDRDINFRTNKWGIDDGSAGLKGQLIKSDSWAEIRLFASQFLSAFLHGSEEKRIVKTPFGEAITVPEDTTKNAFLQGGHAVIDQYAQKILAEIDEKGFYVRVPTGTQFYLYVTQTIDLESGKRGAMLNGDIWKKQNNEN